MAISQTLAALTNISLRPSAMACERVVEILAHRDLPTGAPGLARLHRRTQRHEPRERDEALDQNDLLVAVVPFTSPSRFHYNSSMREKIHRLSSAEKNEVIEKIAASFAQQNETQFAYVYGSFLEDTPFHDIDVGIFLTNIDPESSLRIAADTARRLEEALRLPIDVHPLNVAPLPFLYRVIRGRLIFERDEDLHAEIVEQTVRRYLDIKPVLLRGTQEAFAA